MCQNSYQNKRQGIGNIPVTKLHRFDGRKSIKPRVTSEIDQETCRFDSKDEIW